MDTPATAKPSGLVIALILGWFIAALALGANLDDQTASNREAASAVAAAGVTPSGAEGALAVGSLVEESPALTMGVAAALLLIGGTLILVRAGLVALQGRRNHPRPRLQPHPVMVVVDRRAIRRQRSSIQH